ncbi:MAG: MFS transporter [Hamadaea sp.]|uniref:MFS transporter n=1 Tax=Hamadaea sp. TaxID=2024425 RepID=UPI0017D81C43|nr:MFS transporter [Hamadaea sp.]NUR69339.1 MFS transporter [Hamadaea sp.]NUT17782.1 MFS transporter [Hamadaea sp.]
MGARSRVLIGSLAVTSLVGYGCLFYAYSVLLTPMSRDLDASPTRVTFAMTLCTLASAGTAVLAGRWIDRRGGRGLMTAGSIGATLLLAAASQVDDLMTLYLVWAGVGVTWALVLYEPAFAVIVPRLPAERRALALLTVTVVGGFASTIFLPLTGALVDNLGWRATLLWLAAILGATTIPLHFVAVPKGPATSRTHAHASRAVIAQTMRRPRFWLYAVAFTANSAVVTTLGIQLVSILRDLGHSTTVAAGIAGLIGLLSVTGRIAITALQRWMQPVGVVCGLFGVQACALALLPFVGRDTMGAVLCVVTVGLGFGVATVTRPALVAQHFGTTHFGTVAGMLNTSGAIGATTVPLAFAALRGAAGSVVPVEVCASLFALAGLLLFTSTRTAATAVGD